MSKQTKKSSQKKTSISKKQQKLNKIQLKKNQFKKQEQNKVKKEETSNVKTELDHCQQQLLLKKMNNQKTQLVIKKPEKQINELPSFNMSSVLYSKQQINQVINIYSQNGGDFNYFKQKMPNLQINEIKNCLKIIFSQTLQFISKKIRKICKQKNNQWSFWEYQKLIRQLQKIRNTNRLMPESNIEVRQGFTQTMKFLFEKSKESQLPQLNLSGKSDFEHRIFVQKMFQCYEQFEKFVRGKCRARLPEKAQAQAQAQNQNQNDADNKLKIEIDQSEV